MRYEICFMNGSTRVVDADNFHVDRENCATFFATRLRVMEGQDDQWGNAVRRRTSVAIAYETGVSSVRELPDIMDDDGVPMGGPTFDDEPLPHIGPLPVDPWFDPVNRAQ